MNRNLLFTLMLAMPLASATVRNPFLPFVSYCDALQHHLNQWELHGILVAKNGSIALMRDPLNRWRRVSAFTQLNAEVRVENIESHFVSVRLPSHCEKSLYSWKIKGTQHGMDANNHSSDSLAVH